MIRYVCVTCGSDRVFADAFVSLNDPDDVRVYDATFCEDCQDDCRTKEVDVDSAAQTPDAEGGRST